MKCAAELEIMKEKVIMEREKEQEMKAIHAHVNACAEAINFCENIIAPILEQKAKDGKEIKEYFSGVDFHTDRFNNIHFRTYELEKTYRTVHHRNGTTSRVADGYYRSYTSKSIDFETVKEYMEKYCYEVIKGCSSITVTTNSKCI